MQWEAFPHYQSSVWGKHGPGGIAAQKPPAIDKAQKIFIQWFDIMNTKSIQHEKWIISLMTFKPQNVIKVLFIVSQYYCY